MRVCGESNERAASKFAPPTKGRCFGDEYEQKNVKSKRNAPKHFPDSAVKYTSDWFWLLTHVAGFCCGSKLCFGKSK